MPTPVDSMHFAAWHPIEGDEIGQLGYTICSCGWRSSLDGGPGMGSGVIASRSWGSRAKRGLDE